MTGVPAAALLDLDGTLVDSEPLWGVAIRILTRRFGVPWGDDDDLAVTGAAVPDSAAMLRDRGVAMPVGLIADELHDLVAAQEAEGPPWRPGARDLLAGLAAAGVPSALVTMSYRRLAQVVADQAPPGALTVVVAGDEVERGKPDPQAYLRAAELLGVDADACVAAEDSVTGLTAALASGAMTYAVEPGTVLPAHLAAHPRLVRVSGMVELGAVLGVVG